MVNLCQLENYAAARWVPTVLVAEKEFHDHHLHGHCHHGCDDRSRMYNVSTLNPFSILWTLTSDQQRLRLTQPRHHFWRATPWGEILKTNVFLVFSDCVGKRFLQSSILKTCINHLPNALSEHMVHHIFVSLQNITLSAIRWVAVLLVNLLILVVVALVGIRLDGEGEEVKASLVAGEKG